MIRSRIVVAGRHGQAQADLAEAKLPILLRGKAQCPSLPEAGAAAPEKDSGEAQRGVYDRSRSIVSSGPFAIFKILNSISQVLLGPLAIFKILDSIIQVLLGPFAIFKILNSVSHVLLGPVAIFKILNSISQVLLGSFAIFKILNCISQVLLGPVAIFLTRIV